MYLTGNTEPISIEIIDALFEIAGYNLKVNLKENIGTMVRLIIKYLIVCCFDIVDVFLDAL